jgi:hypothetical protein
MTEPNETITEDEFNQIRKLADEFEAIAETAHSPRWMVVAAMGVALGEQYPNLEQTEEGIEIFSEWARITFNNAGPVKENVQ